MNLSQHRVFLIGGPGGVGKTTLAASLAVRLAESGKRTVVLTVDPAKRLAQALGLDNFHTELQPVPLEKGELFASMLDTQHYFDKLIKRFADNEAHAEKILSHPIYRTMVDSLGGTHEYAAMERLLEFAKDKNYDCVVIDTPPSQNAIELFSAPRRLADFMENSVFSWFQGKTPGYMKLFKTGTKLTMGVFQKIFGANFMESFASLLEGLAGMQAGFRKRHLEVIELLQDESTAFLLVTAATEGRYHESLEFLQRLKEAKIPLSGIALNRLEPEWPSLPPELAASTPEVGRLLKYYDALRQHQSRWVEAFQKSIASQPFCLIPKQQNSLTDVGALSHLGSYLVNLDPSNEAHPNTPPSVPRP